MPAFSSQFQVTWGDLDSNNHLANVGFLNYAAQVRFLYLASAGFTPAAFREAALGPVIFRDDITYKRELRHLETFTVDFRMAAQSEDGSKYIAHNVVRRLDGTVCAEVRTTAAWFDLRQRKIAPPPPALKAAMDAVERTEDFTTEV